MKKNLVLVLGLSLTVLMTGCKSRESAYRQAYEKAMAQDKGQQSESEATTGETETTTVTPVVPAQTQPQTTEDHSDVREIPGDVSVISGNPLKAYSVVVGSFVTQANAQGLKDRLTNQGYDARVLKTNETINGQTGWFRVIASSFADKASAASSRNTLRQSYPGAWLLYRK